MQAVARGKSVPEGEGERGGGKTPAPLRPGQRHAGEHRNRSPYSHRSSTTRTRRPPLPFLSLPGGSGALCGWRSGATARRRGRRWRCGAASTALPAGSWPCAAPACSSARSAPSPPPSGWRPTGSSCCARYLRPAPLGSSRGPRRRRAAGAARRALRVAALGSRRAPAGPCRSGAEQIRAVRGSGRAGLCPAGAARRAAAVALWFSQWSFPWNDGREGGGSQLAVVRYVVATARCCPTCFTHARAARMWLQSFLSDNKPDMNARLR